MHYSYYLFIVVVISIFISFFVYLINNKLNQNEVKSKISDIPSAMDLAIEILAKETQIEDLKKQKDEVYKERNILVALLARTYPSGIKKTAIEGWSPEWHNCVYIELPDGSQCSWHYHDRHSYLFEDLPPYEKEWDGHTTEIKYYNIQELIVSGSIKCKL
jgi:hypothetical protein